MVGTIQSLRNQAELCIDSLSSSEALLEQKKPRPSSAGAESLLYKKILTSDLPAHEKQARRMGEEGFVVMSAGGETVARILCNALYYLLAQQGPLEKVLQELSRSKSLSAAELERLPWLVSLHAHVVFPGRACE